MLSMVIVPLLFSSVLTSQQSSRIFEGIPATKGQFPWQVALYIPNNVDLRFCGGVLISDLWVLTAAHCLYGAFFRIRVLLGTTSSVGDDPDQLELHSHYWTFYQWDPWSHEGDLGLVKLSQAVDFTDYIQPIALANVSATLGTSVFIAGWGSTNDGDLRATNLTYSGLLVAGSDSCSASVGSFCTVPDPNSTTGNICGGDSGSGLVVNASTHFELVGIASFYTGRCGNSPAGFTDPVAFQSWIEEQTKN